MQNNIPKLYFANFINKLLWVGALTIPYFLDWAHLNYTKAFTLEAIFMLAVFLLEIPTGIIADRFGRKWSLVASSIFNVLGWGIFGLFSTYPMLIFGEVVIAAGMALFSGADRALLFDSLLAIKKSDQAKIYFSRYDMAGLLGIIIGLGAGPLVLNLGIFSYPNVLAILFILTAISNIPGILIAFTLNEPQKKHNQSLSPIQGWKGFQEIFKNPVLRRYAFNSCFIAATTFFIYWFYQPILTSIHFPMGYFGLVGAGFNIIGIILLMNIKRLETHWGINKILLYSGLIPGFLFWGITSVESIWLIIPMMIGIASLKTIREPILQDYMNQMIKSENRATILSGISMLEKLIRFILYPICGFLADIHLQLALLFLGILTIGFSLALSNNR